MILINLPVTGIRRDRILDNSRLLMKLKIDRTNFGSITINGQQYDKDVIIRLDKSVHKRKKKLSREKYGTSHILSRKEAKYIYEEGAGYVIIGSGQYDTLKLSDEASEFFRSKKCKVICEATPKAIKTWNEKGGSKVGMFHVTC
jgi:hypothetical protein